MIDKTKINNDTRNDPVTGQNDIKINKISFVFVLNCINLIFGFDWKDRINRTSELPAVCSCHGTKTEHGRKTEDTDTCIFRRIDLLNAYY